MADKYPLETLAVRVGQERGQFNEHSEALKIRHEAQSANALQLGT